MPSLSLPIASPTSGSIFTAVLLFSGAALTAVLGWFSARFSTVARLEKTLLDASRLWVEQSQIRHAQDAVRISELEGEIVRLRGEVNGSLQREESLRNFMKRSGLEPPPRLTILKDDLRSDEDSSPSR